MRPRPIEPLNFTLLGIVLLIAFVFQLVTLLYCACIYPATRQSAELVVTPYDGQTVLPAGPGLVVRASRSTKEDVKTYYPILAQELSRYPRSLIKQINLRQIILCSKLTLNGKAVGGLSWGPAGTVILNVRPREEIGRQSSRWAIHHELFHVIDSVIQSTPGGEDAWASMNPRDFRYGGHEVLDALESTGESPNGQPEVGGFLTYYSMVSAPKDRAEIFSCLMVMPDRLRAVADADTIVDNKSKFLRDFLDSLNHDFASALRSVSVGEAR